MQPHQQRVVDEKADLDTKIIMLSNFRYTPTYDALDEKEKELLSRQLFCMTTYSMILKERIAAF